MTVYVTSPAQAQAHGKNVIAVIEIIRFTTRIEFRKEGFVTVLRNKEGCITYIELETDSRPGSSSNIDITIA